MKATQVDTARCYTKLSLSTVFSVRLWAPYVQGVLCVVKPFNHDTAFVVHIKAFARKPGQNRLFVRQTRQTKAHATRFVKHDTAYASFTGTETCPQVLLLIPGAVSCKHLVRSRPGLTRRYAPLANRSSFNSCDVLVLMQTNEGC